MFNYPHGDLHGLNLDWFLEQWKKFQQSFTGSFTATATETSSPNDPPSVNVTYDQNTGIYDFAFEITKGVKPTGYLIGYQEGTSGTTVPTGTWLSSPPTVTQGNYLWSMTRVIYNDGTYSETYACSRQGVDGAGSPATQTPLMDGTGAVGTSSKFAREDHVHPSDTSKLDASSFVLATTTPIIDGTGDVGTSTDVARADHVHPSSITVTEDPATYEVGFTPTYAHIRKSGNVVTINLYWSSIARTTSYVQVCTLPTGYYPSNAMYIADQITATSATTFYITQAGAVSIKGGSNFTGIAQLMVTYVV